MDEVLDLRMVALSGCAGLFRPFRAGVLDTLITQGGAARRTPLRSALGCYVAAPSGRKLVDNDEDLPGGYLRSTREETVIALLRQQ
jgi:hypothetical protein